jgi:FkbM family methyltransferase
MKALIEKTLWKLGVFGPTPLPPQRTIVGPYAHLHDLPRYQPVRIQLNGHDFDISDGFSFYWMHKEIYKDEVYRFRRSRDRPFIIDLGSNYGVSVTWFKQFCPDARIIAVEADPNIFSMLQRNIERLDHDNISMLNRAASHLSGEISFHCIGADSGRIKCYGSSAASTDIPEQIVNVATISLDQLIGDNLVDFLKIDIEGAELDVIMSSEKLDQVQQLFIEYHSFIDQPQQLSSLLLKLEESGFRYYINRIYSPANPFLAISDNQSMDLQLGISATKV